MQALCILLKVRCMYIFQRSGPGISPEAPGQEQQRWWSLETAMEPCCPLQQVIRLLQAKGDAVVQFYSEVGIPQLDVFTPKSDFLLGKSKYCHNPRVDVQRWLPPCEQCRSSCDVQFISLCSIGQTCMYGNAASMSFMFYMCVNCAEE